MIQRIEKTKVGPDEFLFCGHLVQHHKYIIRRVEKLRVVDVGILEKVIILGLFNPEQLATWTEAKDIALHFKNPIQGRLIGGGLKPLTSKVETSGIYLPVWVGGPGGFPEPRIGSSRQYLFRFKNGFEGVNCGLVRELFKKYPTAPQYVMSELANEIGF